MEMSIQALLDAIRKWWEKIRLSMNPSLYTELKERIDEIEESLDALEQYAVLSRKDNKELQNILSSFVGKLENLTETTAEIVEEEGQNLDRLSDKFDKYTNLYHTLNGMIDDLRSGNMEADMNFLKIVDGATKEDLAQSEFYVSENSFCAIVNNNVYRYKCKEGVGFFEESQTVPNLKNMTRLSDDYGEMFGMAKDLNEPERRAKFLHEQALSLIVATDSQMSSTLESYIGLVSGLLTDGLDYRSTEATAVGNKERLRITLAGKTLDLIHNEAEKSITANLNGKTVASWKQNGKMCKQSVHYKKNEVDYDTFFRNDFVYAFFETHGLAKERMEELFFSMGDVEAKELFPCPKDIKRFEQSFDAIHRYVQKNFKRAKCEKVTVGNKEGLLVKMSLASQTIYVSFHKNGEPNHYFTKMSNGTYQLADDSDIAKAVARNLRFEIANEKKGEYFRD